MGSIGAQSSIDRVLEKHSEEIKDGLLAQLEPAARALVLDVQFSNAMYSISVDWVLAGGVSLPGPSIDIDALAEDYPDCEVGITRLRMNGNASSGL